MCTSDPLHEQISDFTSSGLVGAGDTATMLPENTLVLIAMGTAERDRIDPCEMGEDEFVNDELPRSNGYCAIDDVATLMRGDVSERQDMDEISSPFNETSSINEDNENKRGDEEKIKDFIVRLVTFIIPEI
jgi:hypothetical protein